MTCQARFRNVDWIVEEAQGKPNCAANCEEARLAVLMDIRDELQALHRLLSCQNVSRGFRALSNIAARDERTFKRRVENAARKRTARATGRSRG